MEEVTSFEKMDINPQILRGIYAYGFETPSAIQKKAIVPFATGQDIIAQAQSGKGKTATFSISVLKTMSEDVKGVQALILSPTRELAQQTYTIIENLGKYTKCRFALFVGGQYRKDNIDLMRKESPQCIVGTPGRINDLVRDGYINLFDMRCLILDEADELLSNTFEEQIRDLINFIGEDTQIALYSATMPNEKLQTAYKFMRDPTHILIKNEELTLEGIRQYYIAIEREEWKYETLTDLYNSIVIYQLMIYCNSKRRVESLSTQLIKDGFTCSCIHGEMSSQERSQTMHKFRRGEHRILITTDLLARGIDVQQVSLVVNYDVPFDMENYIHRIGRSGRFGRKGVALNFATTREFEQIKKLESFYQTQINELPQDIESIFEDINKE